MREVKLKEVFGEYCLYDMNDILKDLQKYLSVSFEEFVFKFGNNEDKILNKKMIIEYCRNNFDKLVESRFEDEITEEILNRRLVDYDYFSRILSIYKKKGLHILSLMYYLGEINNREQISFEWFVNCDYEVLLKELEISHIYSIICGRDVVRLLSTLRNIMIRHDEVIGKINNFSTYNHQNIDWFAAGVVDSLYPDSSLVDYKDTGDKTCVCLVKKKW